MKRRQPYLHDPENHGISSEKRVVKNLGGVPRLASGAIEGLKGDGELNYKNGKFLIEAKATIHKSLTVKKEWLDKISEEALSEERTPALTISFVDEYGNAIDFNSDWVLLPSHFVKEFLHEVYENDEGGGKG